MGTTDIRAGTRTIPMVPTVVEGAMVGGMGTVGREETADLTAEMVVMEETGLVMVLEATAETVSTVAMAGMEAKVAQMAGMAEREEMVGAAVRGTTEAMAVTVAMPTTEMAVRAVPVAMGVEIPKQIVLEVLVATVAIRPMVMEARAAMGETAPALQEMVGTVAMVGTEAPMTGSRVVMAEMEGTRAFRMGLAATAVTAEMGTRAAMEGMAATAEMVAMAARGVRAMDK